MQRDVLEQLARVGTKKRGLQEAALRAFADHEVDGTLPTAVRFLFYELEQAGVLSKVCTGARRADQDFGDAVLSLRDAGIIPWNYIVDDTRVLHQWECARMVREYVARANERARIDPWVGTLRPIILTEARTTAGVFARGIAQRYLCAVSATNGQCHGHLVNAVAPLFEDVATRCLYVGDFDLSGSQIEDHARRVIVEHTGRVFSPDDWERIAITETQTTALRARGTKPIRKRDKRYKDGRAHEAFECEALGQRELEMLVSAHLDALLPRPIADVLAREGEERARMRDRLALRGARRTRRP